MFTHESKTTPKDCYQQSALPQVTAAEIKQIIDNYDASKSWHKPNSNLMKKLKEFHKNRLSQEKGVISAENFLALMELLSSEHPPIYSHSYAALAPFIKRFGDAVFYPTLKHLHDIRAYIYHNHKIRDVETLFLCREFLKEPSYDDDMGLGILQLSYQGFQRESILELARKYPNDMLMMAKQVKYILDILSSFNTESEIRLKNEMMVALQALDDPRPYLQHICKFMPHPRQYGVNEQLSNGWMFSTFKRDLSSFEKTCNFILKITINMKNKKIESDELKSSREEKKSAP